MYKSLYKLYTLFFLNKWIAVSIIGLAGAECMMGVPLLVTVACTSLLVKHCGIHREDRVVKADIQSGVRRQYSTAEPLCGAALSGTN